MKSLISVLLLLPAMAFAKGEPITLSFNAVSIVQFGQAMFKGMMKRDFVVSPDVVGVDRRITIDVKTIDRDDLPNFVENLLAHEGIQTTLRNGIYYLTLNRDHGLEPHDEAGGSTLSKSFKDTTIGAADVDRHIEPDGSGLHLRKDEDESEVFEPINRTSEFVAAVIAAGFGRQSATPASGRVVLTGSKATIAKMLSLCNSLDTALKMVDVSASWIEVTSSSGSGRGISLAASFLGTKLGVSLGSVSSGSAVSLKSTRFDLVIDALNSDGRFKQITNSHLVGEDRTKLNLIVGDETPTVSSTGNDNAGNRLQSIVYRPSGVIIEAVPKVLGSGRISLDVDAQISSFKATANGVVGSPTLIKRQVKTTVALGNGDVILLGGLQDSQTTDSAFSLPFLPASWSAKSASNVQTDLVLVMSAKILHD
jgi:type II secretory pathway component GspD/PulD (secretin)